MSYKLQNYEANIMRQELKVNVCENVSLLLFHFMIWTYFHVTLLNTFLGTNFRTTIIGLDIKYPNIQRTIPKHRDDDS